MHRPRWLIAALMTGCAATAPSPPNDRGTATRAGAQAPSAIDRIRQASPAICSRADPRVGSEFAVPPLPIASGGTPRPLLRAGRPALVAFWAGWCEPCREEIPLYLSMRTQLQTSGVDLVLVSVESDLTAVLASLNAFGISADQTHYGGEIIVEQFFQGTMPWTVIVDAQGVIRASHSGFDETCIPLLEAQAVEVGLSSASAPAT